MEPGTMHLAQMLDRNVERNDRNDTTNTGIWVKGAPKELPLKIKKLSR